MFSVRVDLHEDGKTVQILQAERKSAYAPYAFALHSLVTADFDDAAEIGRLIKAALTRPVRTDRGN